MLVVHAMPAIQETLHLRLIVIAWAAASMINLVNKPHERPLHRYVLQRMFQN